MERLAVIVVIALALMVPVSGNADDNKLFNQIDADKSGHLSKDELLKANLGVVKDQKGQQRLAHGDLVKDGKAAALSEEQKHLLFEQLDKDKDGYVTWKEWSRASPDGFVLFRF